MYVSRTRYRNILIIDNEEIDLFLAKNIISETDFSENITFYNNPRLALSYLDNIIDVVDFPDLILLDLNMPEISGEDFLVYFHRQFASGIGRNTKLVVLTAFKQFKETNQINSRRFPSLLKIIEKPLSLNHLETV